MVQGFEYVDYNDVEGLKKLVEEINTTPKELEEQGRKRGVAALMFEALQGEGGVLPGSPEFFTAARQLCDETNALLICDEVQIGMVSKSTLFRDLFIHYIYYLSGTIWKIMGIREFTNRTRYIHKCQGIRRRCPNRSNDGKR